MSRCVKVVWAPLLTIKINTDKKRSPPKEAMRTLPGSTSFTRERNLLLRFQAAKGEVDPECPIILSQLLSNIVFLTRRG